jgi:[ribosomal protein S18]-alanine N-acetyltransferase
MAMLNNNSTPPRSYITNAIPDQKQEISNFLNQDNLIHRHLDWFSPLDWLGQSPFLIEKLDRNIQAILIAAPEVSDASWIRLFCVNNNLLVEDLWRRIFAKATSLLISANIKMLAALGTNDWFTQLLKYSGFTHQEDIVILDWKGDHLSSINKSQVAEIRPMREEDLPIVFQVDQAAFAPLWQNSLASLTRAFNQPGVSTVALSQDQILGYQISTATPIQGHLARLAVHPDYQGQQVASTLVSDLLEKFARQGIWFASVNTQAGNQPSLAVYHKFGFQRTQANIPVYQRDLIGH